LDDFDKFIEKTIFPELSPLEETRKSKVTSFWAGTIVIIIIALSAALIFQSAFTAILTLILSVLAVGFLYNILFKSYDADFSSKAIRSIVKFIDKNLEYQRNSHISEAEYKSSRLFLTGYDGFSGRDLVYGKLDKTAVKFSYLYTYYEEESEDSDGHKTTRRYTIFDGLFFIADFNKRFNGEVYLFPHGFRFFSPRKGTKKIPLEDPDFNSLFDVYGSDPVISMYVISTSLMKRLLDFRNKVNAKRGVSLSLINSTLNIAVSNYKPFKVPFFSTVFDKEIYYHYLDQLKFATGIVDDLNLNTRIWTVDSI
jgi:hypothetical protein